MNARVTSALALAALMLAGCSKYAEQCHQVALEAKTVENTFIEMRNAADVGNTAAVAKAKVDFDGAIAKLAAMTIEGDGLKEEMLRNTTKQLVDAAPSAAEALQKLAVTIEADPTVVKNYLNDKPPVTAGAGVTKELEAAVTDVSVEASVLSKLPCK